MVVDFRDEDDEYDSDDQLDALLSDEEGVSPLKKYPLHKQLKDMQEYKWEVGTLSIVEHHSNRGLSFSKCDGRRKDTWQLKSCYKKHIYSKTTRIGIMNCKWLNKVFMKKIAENPKIKLTTLAKKCHYKWNVDLTKFNATRVRLLALDEINGTYVV
ncbi:hypothetical protein Ahy_B02g058137 [Arachis hypogaea]|uniref:Transposase MuDR plant domain-containing protein n=1 Tax=Arachis hypogaea TaxID=3818 RepID=A0A445ADX6_ARAHY|nr:hypothetical protein Ahy_B02g058137 [Arachis hypogaea]